MINADKNVVTTWPEFQERWDGVRNFIMRGETVPFSFDLPSLDRIVEEIRKDEMSNVGSGAKGSTLLKDDRKAEFLKLPIDEAMDRPFSLSHFKLSRFDEAGKFLHGFEKQVLDPWRAALLAHGFTFDRCYPIVFISGKGCATNYHMDYSHVLAWQRYGVKRFCGLVDPDRWAPREARLVYTPHEFARPETMREDDALCFDMRPGDVLWNALLTPHWVEAADEVAMSFNISHGGLRLHGKLCRNEQELHDYRAANPDKAAGPLKATY